jgi:hypothetical protein
VDAVLGHAEGVRALAERRLLLPPEPLWLEGEAWRAVGLATDGGLVLCRGEQRRVLQRLVPPAFEAAPGGAGCQAVAQATDAQDASKAGAKRGSSGKKGKADTVKVRQWVFHVDGVAPTDMEVAEYIARLGADPLFRDVDLQFSEEFPYKEGVQMRKFQLSFRLSPEAEKILGVSASAATAAAASPAPAAKGDS